MYLKRLFTLAGLAAAGATAPLFAMISGDDKPGPAAAAASYAGRVDPSAFPAHESDKQGTVADPAMVRLIVPGVDKFSIYRLIGPPHFGEGITRRWNYLLRFPATSGTEPLRCRMEIRFARRAGEYNVVVTEILWKEQACLDRVAGGH